jgi:hypothetical protein
MTGIVHPCKIYNVLAVGAPFLYIGPRATPAGALCARTPGARRVAHGDVDGALSAIGAAAAERSLRNLAASLEVSRPFSRRALVPRFTAMLSRAVEEPAPIEVT